MEFSIQKKKEENTDEAIRIKMSAWPECYYLERDGLVRRSYLEEAQKEHLTPEENEVRAMLWERRYPGLMSRSTSSVKDAYLRVWFDFRYASENLSHMFSYKSTVKQILADLAQMGFTAIEPYGEMGEEILYAELYHMAMLYIALCREDRVYGSFLFGMGKVSDDKVLEKMAKEFANNTRTVPEALNMKKECALWTRAIETAFFDTFPDKKEVLETAIKLTSKKKDKK